MSDRSFYERLKDRLERESVVVATITEVIGSAPREVGAKMAVCQDGSIIGTIGGGAGEGKVIDRALTVFKTGNKQFVEINLTGTPKKDIQGVCGGKVRVWLEKWAKSAIALVETILELFEVRQSAKLITPFNQEFRPYLIGTQNFSRERDFWQEITNSPKLQFIETIQPSPILLIIGGGHVAVSLAQIAHFAGFAIAVQDDRPQFVTEPRFPQAILRSGSITEILDKIVNQAQLYVALVTRGYQQDIEALQTLLQRPLAYQYIGAIGSQKRIQLIQRELQRQGIPIARLPNFYAPIGLDIGALTPEEIAISICGELIKVRRGGTGLSLCEQMQHSQKRSIHHRILHELS